MPEVPISRPFPPRAEDYAVVSGSQGPRRDFRISVGLREGRVFDVSEAVRTARAWMKRRVESGQPALSGMFTRAEVTYASEPQHRPLSSSKWLVRILRPIVEVAADLMQIRGNADLVHRSRISTKPVGDDAAGSAVLLQEVARFHVDALTDTPWSPDRSTWSTACAKPGSRKNQHGPFRRTAEIPDIGHAK